MGSQIGKHYDCMDPCSDTVKGILREILRSIHYEQDFSFRYRDIRLITPLH